MMLLNVNQLDEAAKRYESFIDTNFENVPLMDAAEAFVGGIDKSIAPELVKGNITGNEENLRNRKKMIRSFGLEPAEFAYERAIGENDSVYSNFIELLSTVKKKVGRIVVKEGAENLGHATGFMVSDRLLMTNWHVFETKESVSDSVVQFHYEYNTLGNPMTPVTFKLNSEDFFYSFKGLDFCLIAVNTIDVTAKHDLSSIGYIPLDLAPGKLGNENQELLNIIHHPKGDYKQLSIRENRFVKILPTTLWYESDTAQGSSGSPVFNDQWQLVALHHMGIAKKNDDKTQYLDKNGDIIPIVDNKIDTSKIHWIANEGIRISVIIKHIVSEFPDSLYIKKLLNGSTPSSERTISTVKERANQNNTMETNNNLVHISFPPSLIESQGTVNISFSIDGTSTQRAKNNLEALDENLQLDVDELAQESKRLEKAMDYSKCKGYQSMFLGSDFDIKIPQPQHEISKLMAKVSGTDSNVLKYYKFSVIFHSARMMPLISAINIDGNLEKRLDRTERRDKWIRDNRIDYNFQLDQGYYKKSGFDRGHMSRREDANWGVTPEEAKRNADLTCVYTNACPQVPSLNRSNRSGLWGKLEKIVLEKGAVKEADNTNKISVFSGPIFKDSDPVFRGALIPIEFYKVILWVTDSNTLKVTAFKLSQLELLDDIDLEDIDIDKNIQFKEFQCSLKFLQDNTKIDFSELFEFDTFVGDENIPIEVDSEEKFQNHLLETEPISK